MNDCFQIEGATSLASPFSPNDTPRGGTSRRIARALPALQLSEARARSGVRDRSARVVHVRIYVPVCPGGKGF